MRDIADVLCDLAAVGERIQVLKDNEEAAYARRLALFLEARTFDPPVTYKMLGAAAGVGEEAVQAALDKGRGKRQRRKSAA